MVYRNGIQAPAAWTRELKRMRQSGTRPVGPIVLTEDEAIAAWCRDRERGLYAIVHHPRSPLGRHAQLLADLGVLISTHLPFALWSDVCTEISAHNPRILQLIDRKGRHPAQLVIDPRRRAIEEPISL